MRIPNADAAVVERRKVTGYLLNAAHPDNGGKAAFFAALGFEVASADRLIDALLTVARGEITEQAGSPHGDKYVVDGVLSSPSGKRGLIRTVWIVERGKTTPRLVTAYPRE